MNARKKYLFLSLLCGSVLFSLTGCNTISDLPMIPASSSEIGHACAEAMGEVFSASGMLSVDASVSGYQDGFSFAFDCLRPDGNSYTVYTSDGMTLYAEGASGRFYQKGDLGWQYQEHGFLQEDFPGLPLFSPDLFTFDNSEIKESYSEQYGIDVYELTRTVTGAELSDLFLYLPVSGIDLEDADLKLTLLVDKNLKLPIEQRLSLSDTGGDGMSDRGTLYSFDILIQFSSFNTLESLAVPEGVSEAVAADFEIPILDGEETGYQAPEIQVKKKAKSTESFAYVSSDGLFGVNFDTSGTLDAMSVSDEGLRAFESAEEFDSLEFTLSFLYGGLDGYASAVSDRESVYDYYSHVAEGLSEEYVSDVEACSVGAFPAYWYKRQYTDSNAEFVSMEYAGYIELSDSCSLYFVLSGLCDPGLQASLGDAAYFDILEHVTIERLEDAL